jgi:S-adenosylmethionine:tRNA ribosyltransferase-isomerase
MASFDDILGLYDFAVPKELIAQAPASPRDAARLLVHRRGTGETTDAQFRDVGQYLPPGSLLVLNETKVVPAKLHLQRSTGGTVSVLILGREGGGLKAFADHKLTVGEALVLADGHAFTVEAHREKEWILVPSFPFAALRDVFETHGAMPLPPYIKQTPLSPQEQRREYQTVFAREEGSIAAPTASLHFTERLLRKLEKSGIELAFVTLHVHLGTFAPLTEDQWKKGALHREEYRIPPATAFQIEKAKREKRPVIAVGTTVVRTLESAADASGRIVHPSGHTQLFIKEGFTFHIVDGLLTNFHVPKSSLLMLVSAFIGSRGKTLELYRGAVERKYRLFSFGDAMLIL